jgi:chromosome segregation ATPase
MTQKGIAMERRRGLDTRRLVVIVIFFCALAIPLFAVAGCDQQLARMEENQIKLQAMVAANARELATISSQLDAGQGKINASIQTLDADTQQVADSVTSVRSEQRQFREAVAAGNEGLNRRIGYVEDNQRSLQGSVAQVSDVTQRTAADLTSLAREHAALQETMRTNQQELTGSLSAAANDRQRIATGIGELHQANQELARDIAAKHDTLYEALQDNDQQSTQRFTTLTSGQGRLSADVAGVHTQLNTMAEDLAAGNSSLKEQLATGQQTLTTQIGELSASQQQLQTSVDTLGAKADRTAADLVDTKSSLQETLRVSREALTGQIDGLSASQQSLQTSVDTLGTKAEQTAAGLVDTKSSLQETLRVSREVLTGQIAASLQNQQALQSDVRDLSDKADKLTTNISDVSSEQTALHATVRTSHDAVVAAMVGLSDRQETLRSGIETLDGKADRAAGDIASLTTQQQSLYEAVKANQDSIVPKLADVATTTDQTARDVAALNSGQAALQQSIQAGNVALTTRATELAESQQALRSGIDNLGQTTQQVASDVAKMTVGQDALHQTLKAHSDRTDQQAASLASVQEEMGTSLDTLTATAGQTALDIIAVTTRQGTIQAALQSHSDTLGAQMAQLADNQQQVQTSLDTVTATTSQASLDALTLNNSQGRLGQAVQAGRQEMADKLADMAQGQQKWSERLDAAQAKVTTIGDSVATLEQRIAKLHDLLQASIQGTTTILGATSQQRLQFEAKVSQDMQAVIDSLAQVRQTQTSLQEQITQVQKSTQGQADSLRSVIEQMKTSPNANDRIRDEVPDVEDTVGAFEAEPAPAEVTISNAAEVPPAPAAPQAAE